MSPPYMPLYVGDYLRDTRGLSAEEHGAYLLLIMTMWSAGGTLPADEKKLARYAACTPIRWAKIRDEILGFFVIDGDVIRHKRLGEELEKAQKKSISRANSGSLGGKANALKSKDVPAANAAGLLKHLPEPEPKEERDRSLRSLVPSARSGDLLEAAQPEPPQNPAQNRKKREDEQFDRFRAEYPKRVGSDGKAESRKAFERAIRRGADPEAIIAAARRFASSPDGQRSQFVPMSASWLNKDRFDDGQEDQVVTPINVQPKPLQPVPDRQWTERLNWMREREDWRPQWGPIPGDPGSLVPEHLITDGHRLTIKYLQANHRKSA